MGCVVGGFGGGSLVFNYIQTAILNPDNVSPAASGPDEVRLVFYNLMPDIEIRDHYARLGQ